MIFHFLSLCVFISIQNIGRSIPLNSLYRFLQSLYCVFKAKGVILVVDCSS